MRAEERRGPRNDDIATLPDETTRRLVEGGDSPMLRGSLDGERFLSMQLAPVSGARLAFPPR